MDELFTILHDFIKDLLTTFPEYNDSLHIGLKAILNNEKENPAVDEVFEHCKGIYPQRFFDILYQKDELFTEEIFLLPNIDFAILWKMDISDHTRTVIWKYLQLVLFSIVHKEGDSESFGDTAKLFEAIDETEFKNKLEETIAQMTELFDTSGTDISEVQLPNPDELQEHISTLLEGNLGKLAREIAEETAQDINADMTEISSVGDVFKKLFRNPGKLMGLVKKVGSKLDGKLKSGEIKESELISEASDLITKMNSMPGMKDMQTMLGKMGLPLGKKNQNMGAFQTHMQRNLNAAKRRERLQQKLRERQAMAQQQMMMAQALQACQQAAMTQTASEATPPEPPQKKKKKKRRKKKRIKNRSTVLKSQWCIYGFLV